MRRWAIRILLLLLTLLLLAAGAVQGLLMSDLPRQWVLSALQQRTGLHITAATLQTTWGGQTTILDVTVALPASDQPALTIAAVYLQHNHMLSLLWRRALRIEAVELDQPVVTLRRLPMGQWNVAELAVMVAGGGKSQAPARSSSTSTAGESAGRTGGAGAAPAARAGRAAWPARPGLTLRSGKIMAELPGQPPRTLLENIDIRAELSSSSAWKLTIAADPDLRISGVINPDQQWLCDLNVNVAGGTQQLELFLAQPRRLELQGHWVSQYDGAALRARVQATSLRVDDAVGNGLLVLTAEGNRLTVQSEQVRLTPSPWWDHVVELAKGRFVWQQGVLQLQEVYASSAGLKVTVDGRWDSNSARGQGKVRWRGALPVGEQGVQHGTAELAVEKSGELWQGKLDLESQGQLPLGRWDAKGTVSGWFRDRRHAQWQCQLSKLELARGDEILSLRDVAATISMAGNKVQVQELSIAQPASLQGSGDYDLSSRDWRLEVQARELPAPRELSGPLRLDLSAHGDAQHAQFGRLQLASDNFSAQLAGSYRVHEKSPLELTGHGRWQAPPGAEAALAALGPWRFDGQVAGTPWPARLRFVGKVSAASVQLGRQPLALDIPLTANWGNGRIAGQTGAFDLLGGQCELAAILQVAGGVSGELAVTLRKVPMDRLSQLAPALSAQGLLSLTAQLQAPRLALADLQCQGSGQIDQLQWLGYHVPKVSGNWALQDGVVLVKDVVLEQPQGQLTGSASFPLKSPEKIELSFEASDWRTRLPESELELRTQGHVQLKLDLEHGQSTGAANWKSSLFSGNNSLGQVRGAATLPGQKRIVLQQFQGEILGGSVRAQGAIDLAHWQKSHGEVEVKNLDLSALRPLAADLDQWQGLLTGRLTVGPATLPRPLEPTVARLTLESPDGKLRGVAVQSANLLFYVGDNRLLLDHGQITAAGGSLESWASVSRHGSERFAHVTLRLQGLELEQLWQALAPQARAASGRLSGQLTMLMPVGRWRQGSAQGELTVRDCDLGSNPIFATLYGALSVPFGAATRSGQGQARLQIEGGTLHVRDLQYFNRGVEFRAEGSVDDLFARGKSPIRGLVLASARPLKDIPLPWLDKLDRLLTTLQNSAQSARVSGTVNQPEVRLLPLADVLGALQRMIRSQRGLEPAPE